MPLREPDVITLIEHDELELGIELAETTCLAVLAGHQPLILCRELDEAVLRRQPEVRSKGLCHTTAGPPLQRKFDRFVHPLDVVEVEELRKMPLRRMSESLIDLSPRRRVPTPPVEEIGRRGVHALFW